MRVGGVELATQGVLVPTARLKEPQDTTTPRSQSTSLNRTASWYSSVESVNEASKHPPSRTPSRTPSTSRGHPEAPISVERRICTQSLDQQQCGHNTIHPLPHTPSPPLILTPPSSGHAVCERGIVPAFRHFPHKFYINFANYTLFNWRTLTSLFIYLFLF